MLSLSALSRHVAFNDPGDSIDYVHPVLRRRHRPSPLPEGLGTPNTPTIRFRWDFHFEAVRFACAATCRVARPPGGSNPSSSKPAQADGDFYFRASSKSVTLLAAGYHYGGDWASSTGGTFTRKNVS